MEIALGVAIFLWVVTMIFLLILNSENKMLHSETEMLARKIDSLRFAERLQGNLYDDLRADYKRVKDERKRLLAQLTACRMTGQPATRPEDV